MRRCCNACLTDLSVPSAWTTGSSPVVTKRRTYARANIALERILASMLTKVTKLERLGGFRLGIHFNDGSHGVHDFTVLMRRPGEMLDPLRDEVYFARVFLEFGAPTWPNGYDMAPEWLRREMEKAGELSREAAE
jgi:Protein of unknown function (DUF2442)